MKEARKRMIMLKSLRSTPELKRDHKQLNIFHPRPSFLSETTSSCSSVSAL